MAYIFTVNVTYSSAYDLMVALKARLVAAGWTVPRSGTGTGGTYNSSGDSISTGTVLGALTRAWFVVSAPSISGQVRQLCVQQIGPSETSWRIKYSASAGFTGGSPAAGVTPSATDEVVLIGGGTDASPSGGNWLESSPISSQPGNYHIVANNAAPYDFILFGKRNSGGFHGSFGMDVVDAGSSSDQDLAVLFWTVTTGNGPLPGNGALANYGGAGRCWFKYNNSGTFQNVIIARMFDANNTSIFPGGAGVNAHAAKDDLVPCIWMRAATQTNPSGYKGVSHLFKWIGSARAYADTLSVASSGAKDYIHVGNVTDPSAAVPWNGSTPVP